MTDLAKLSTVRLLGRLSILRSKIVQPWNHYGDEAEDNAEYAADIRESDKIKALLFDREHYPRGKEGRRLRQKAKQNR